MAILWQWVKRIKPIQNTKLKSKRKVQKTWPLI
jgi:hypothetical protein